MSRVHEKLKHRKGGRRPARSTRSAVPSVLVNDSGQAQSGKHETRQALQAVRDTEARLKSGILELQDENARLRRENRELHERLRKS